MGALTPALLWTIVVIACIVCAPYILTGAVLIVKLVAALGVLLAAVIYFLLAVIVSLAGIAYRACRRKKPEPLSVPEARAMIRKSEIDDLMDRLTP